MQLDMSAMSDVEAYRLFTSALLPRPIAFVSTVGWDGSRNLAPFSLFMGAATDPPMVAVSIEHREGGPKDTARNVRETGELVINPVSEEIAEAMSVASGDYPYNTDEFNGAWLTPVAIGARRAPANGEALDGESGGETSLRPPRSLSE